MRGYVLTFPGDQGPAVFVLGRELGFWPTGRTWWFGWNEREISLPAPLKEAASVFDARWETARVFAAAAELRFQQHGRERLTLLLLEEEARRRLPPELVQSATHKFPFFAQEGRRLLAGVRLSLPGSEIRGRVEFPRPLDYGMGGDKLDHALGVRVYLYRGEDGALRLVRYAEITVVTGEDRRRAPWLAKPFVTEMATI